MLDQHSLLFAFVLGLFSTMHCLGMCGSIIAALACSLPREVQVESTRRNSLVLGYNLGRILVYTLLGLLGGLGGSLLGASLDTALWRTVANLIAALSLILIGIYLGGWIPQVRSVDRIGGRIWHLVQPIGRRFLPVRTLGGALASGFIWGWIPCGLVYYALVLSVPLGDPLRGALFMLAFGAGTLPGMLATGMFGGLLAALTRDAQIRQVAGFLIVVIGIFALLFGESIAIDLFDPAAPE